MWIGLCGDGPFRCVCEGGGGWDWQMGGVGLAMLAVFFMVCNNIFLVVDVWVSLFLFFFSWYAYSLVTPTLYFIR